jgi:hypothetical protein
MRLTSELFLEIGGLVVKVSEREKGIEEMLVQHLDTLVNNGTEIRVRCISIREDAHRFYSNINYIEFKEQKVFSKKTK